MVDSVWALTLGPSAEGLLALLWSVAIIAVAVPLAVAKYRRG